MATPRNPNLRKGKGHCDTDGCGALVIYTETASGAVAFRCNGDVERKCCGSVKTFGKPYARETLLPKMEKVEDDQDAPYIGRNVEQVQQPARAGNSVGERKPVQQPAASGHAAGGKRDSSGDDAFTILSEW